MADPDTELGRGPGGFPSTRWSVVLSARDAQAPGRRDSLEALLRAYWRPVYLYIRQAWRRSNEDAKDATQEFLTRLVEGGVLEKYEREKGRFRAYLKGALRHFLMDLEKGATRQKRA
jgi:RNA polymerase sigma-70 factor (ECF subfamily)